jgi:2-oxo-3-hexenedioate decarboxylase
MPMLPVPGLPADRLQRLARTVDDAARQAKAIPMLTSEPPGLTLEAAYAVQRASMQLRVGRGERVVGMKMGLTSLAKMRQMGVHEPIYGHLTDAMVLGDGGNFDPSKACHPRVEPEIAFILGEDLRGPTTPAQAMRAVASVHAALEIIDSRYQAFQFTLPDVVADNASSHAFVLGARGADPARLDASNLGMVMEINGRAVQLGSSAAIYEHPARSLAALANMLHPHGEVLRAGWVVLAGGATAAVALKPGDHARVLVDRLGSVEFFVNPL